MVYWNLGVELEWCIQILFFGNKPWVQPRKKRCLSSLRAARDILLGGVSVPRQQNFHTILKKNIFHK